MIRILSTLSVVIATVLGVVVDQPIIWAAAGLVLIAVIVLFILALSRRHARQSRPSVTDASLPQPPRKDDELSSLGIIDIRPKESRRKDSAPGAADESRTPVESLPAEPEAVATGEGSVTGVEEEPVDKQSEHRQGAAEVPARDSERGANKPVAEVIRKRPKSIYTAIAPGEEDIKDILMPFLQSLQSAIGAHTVCLLRQEGESPQVQLYIEAIVSRSSYARSFGQFQLKTPLMKKDGKGVTLRRVGDWDLPSSTLGYYREPIAARQVALVPVRYAPAAGTYFLLTDSMDEDGLENPRQVTLLEHFARLLGDILDKGDPTQPTPTELADNQSVRPRRAIIAEEMEKARAEENSLAFALVHLNRAEYLAEEGEEVVARAEADLKARLQQIAPESRVEQFGELTYGLFFTDADMAAVESMAASLQGNLADDEGLLEGGVSIGVVLMQEHHDSPDALRADATNALREAFESGTCTIVA
jgi:hypothetical protein